MLTHSSAFGPDSSLDHFFVSVFTIEREPKPNYKVQFLKMLIWLRRVLRRRPRLSDLRAETFEMFQTVLEEMGLAHSYARTVLGTRFITLWRFAAEKELAPPCTVQRGSLPGRGALPLPQGSPGTLLHLFWERYLPEVLQPGGCQPENYWCLFRRLRECFGRDLQPGELSPQVLAQFTSYGNEKGWRPITTRDRRNRLLTLWRFAHGEGLAPAVPQLRPIKVDRDAPDCWSIEEYGRIVDASRNLVKPPIGGVPANEFWPALLLTTYYTALRRGTLIRLRTCDFDLESGWLTVPGCFMKNRVGQKFRLGEQAVNALRAIWNPKRERMFPAPLRRGCTRHLSRHFNRILALAGVAKSDRKCFSLFHKVRRTSVTMTAAHAGMAQAIAIAGHSGAAVNARYIDPRFLPQHDATRWLPEPSAKDACQSADVLRLEQRPG